MSRPRGKWRSLSLPRRLIAEIMRVCRDVPTVTAERRMDLAEVVQARGACEQRPLWTAIFTKAFALVSAQTPALCRSYIRLPWPHLYEHPDPIACVTVEREYEGEEAVFFTRIRRAHHRSLVDLDAQLRYFKNTPVMEVSRYRRALRLAAKPWPIRRLSMWLGLHGSGRWRERIIGTFGLSSPASQGAGMLSLITGLTATVHYGMFDADGRLEVRLTFDHRVLDGALAARALVRLENTLRGPILQELRSRINSLAA
ncbi:MAG: hypothetical protein HY040_24725 [Planctomycetes bacterium]|nr:hypothetical protein [Planctomycetota bacterium]